MIYPSSIFPRLIILFPEKKLSTHKVYNRRTRSFAAFASVHYVDHFDIIDFRRCVCVIFSLHGDCGGILVILILLVLHTMNDCWIFASWPWGSEQILFQLNPFGSVGSWWRLLPQGLFSFAHDCWKVRWTLVSLCYGRIETRFSVPQPVVRKKTFLTQINRWQQCFLWLRHLFCSCSASPCLPFSFFSQDRRSLMIATCIMMRRIFLSTLT